MTDNFKNMLTFYEAKGGIKGTLIALESLSKVTGEISYELVSETIRKYVESIRADLEAMSACFDKERAEQ